MWNNVKGWLGSEVSSQFIMPYWNNSWKAIFMKAKWAIYFAVVVSMVCIGLLLWSHFSLQKQVNNLTTQPPESKKYIELTNSHGIPIGLAEVM